MTVSYKIEVYNPTNGELEAIIQDYHFLRYTKKVNDVGMCEFQINGLHKDIPIFVRNGLIVISRMNPERGITSWQKDFYGIYLKQLRTTTRETGSDGAFAVTAPSIDHKLAWRINAYPADTTNFTSFTSTAAETIMKRLVRYNFDTTYAIVANGRDRLPTAIGIGIENDQARGNTIDYASSNAPILKDLQALARIAGGDFGLVYVSPTQFNLEFYPNQLGTNRTSTVIFSIKYGNMDNPEYVLDWINEKTVAIVKGQGVGTDRDTVIRTSPTYDDDSYDVETFVDARNVTKGSTAALNSKGDEALQKNIADETFDFKVLQNESFVYGKDYFLGDRVTGKYHTISTALKITGVTVKHDKSKSLETIDLDLSPIPF